MKKNPLIFAVLLAAVSCGGPEDGTYRLQLFTTNDVHGRYFDSLYVEEGTRQSLYAVSHYVDSVRNAIVVPSWESANCHTPLSI